MKSSKLQAVVLTALIAVSPLSSAGKLYKWVDENGNVQYSDSLPPEAVTKGHDEMTDDGVTRKSVDRAKTKKELAREERLKAEQQRIAAEAERERRLQENRDRVLLATYLTERDIIASRDDKLSLLEGSIQLSERNLESLKKNLELLKKDLKSQKQESSSRTRAEKKVAKTESQIELFEAHIAKKRQEMKNLEERYAAELERFRELKTSKRD